jgi:hypothetical protein
MRLCAYARVVNRKSEFDITSPTGVTGCIDSVLDFHALSLLHVSPLLCDDLLAPV